MKPSVHEEAPVVALPPSPALGSLETYLNMIHRYPTLSLEEERKLVHRLYYGKELEAARMLILHHLRFVVRIARGLSGYGLPLADLIQEGNIGLIKAVKRYNPKFEVRLMSFAVHWIKAEIYDYILKNWRLVRIATTKQQKKLFFNLRKTENQLQGSVASEGIEQQLTEKLDAPLHEIRAMRSKFRIQEISLDGPSHAGEQTSTAHDYESHKPLATIYDPKSNFSAELEEQEWEKKRRAQLRTALSSLEPRAASILIERWITEPKKTLQDLAQQYNISIERVRQIEKQALKALREQLGHGLTTKKLGTPQKLLPLKKPSHAPLPAIPPPNAWKEGFIKEPLPSL